MTTSKFIRKLLHLKDVVVKNHEFSNWYRELHLHLEPRHGGALCPTCHRRGKIVHSDTAPRVWRDLQISGTTVFFHYAPREILCRSHGRIQEKIPWAGEYDRISYRLEFLVLVSAQLMTQKAAAHMLGMAKSTFSDILHRSIKKYRAGHRIRGLKSIGVDEVSYHKGRKFATVIYDLDRARVVWVANGKGRDTVDRFFEEELSEFQRKQIRTASCDMARAYTGAIKDYCPNATLVIDKFHIVKALNEAVDEVRKEQWRVLEGEEKKAMKGLRWLLFRHSRNRTKSQTRFLNRLKTGNRRIFRAWVLKDEFESFWNFKYAGAAENFLKGWVTAARKSRLKPLKEFAETLARHWDNIISYVKVKVTNSVAEGMNRVIRLTKNRASGFSSFDAFTDMIFLMVGDVDIPCNIPSKFRTLKMPGKAI